MGTRGPAPKPTALKAAAGNPGRRVLNESEPVPPAGAIRPLAWMALGKDAKRIWRSLAPTLISMGTLTTADVVLFGRYCQALARRRIVSDFLKLDTSSGTTYPIKDENGKVRYVATFPQLAELRQIDIALRMYEAQFGIGAANRSRIQVDRATGAPVTPGATKSDSEFFSPRMAG